MGSGFCEEMKKTKLSMLKAIQVSTACVTCKVDDLRIIVKLVTSLVNPHWNESITTSPFKTEHNHSLEWYFLFGSGQSNMAIIMLWPLSLITVISFLVCPALLPFFAGVSQFSIIIIQEQNTRAKAGLAIQHPAQERLGFSTFKLFLVATCSQNFSAIKLSFIFSWRLFHN